MPPKRTLTRKGPSFNSFLRTLIKAVRVCANQLSHSTAPLDLKILSYEVGVSLEHGEYAQAVYQADSLAEQQYGDPESHFWANQLALLVRKVPFTHSDLDPEGSAMEKFFQAEDRCAVTNANLASLVGLFEGRYADVDVKDIRIVDRMRRWVRYVLGDSPVLRRIHTSGGFGPGASIGVSGNATHLGAKLEASKWTATPGVLPYTVAALSGFPMFWRALDIEPPLIGPPDLRAFAAKLEDRMEVVAHNKITLVPKTAKVHRTIAVEPLINSFLQKGVEVEMKRKLRSAGIDLEMGQSANGQLARVGSVTGDYATIDLSAASDSLSIMAAKLLLPPDWFDLLNHLRAPSYIYRGEVRRYEKFTSMGNGFCFPLETLLFAAAARAVYDELSIADQFLVYGDDIIVNTSSALRLIEVLELWGFVTNKDKTFLHGPFRESCGQDWFGGVNVRPVTLDCIPECWSTYYALLNNLKKTQFDTSELESVFLEAIPEKWRLLRPVEGPEDTAIDSCLDVFMASRHARWDRNIQGWSWKELKFTPSRDSRAYSPESLLAGALHGSVIERRGEDCFTLRRSGRRRLSTARGVHLRCASYRSALDDRLFGLSPTKLTR